MKKGLLVVNKYYRTPRLDEQYDLLVKAFFLRKITLQTRENDSFCKVNIEEETKDFDFVVMWDKDVILATRLEQAGLRVFNSAECIRICDDKAYMQLAFEKAKITTPKTIIAPMTYRNIGYTDIDFSQKIIDELGCPLIIKEAQSSYGMGVYLAENSQKAAEIFAKIRGDIVCQQYISSSRGRDIRINVVGGKVVCGALRSNDSDFRSNILQGGRMENIEITDEMEALALNSTLAVGADFAGVDILFGRESLLVCEINTSMHFGTMLKTTGINLAESIADHVNAVIYGGDDNAL